MNYKSIYCHSCYYKKNLNAAISIAEKYGQNEANKIQPCNECDGECLYIYDEIDPKEYFND